MPFLAALKHKATFLFLTIIALVSHSANTLPSQASAQQTTLSQLQKPVNAYIECVNESAYYASILIRYAPTAIRFSPYVYIAGASIYTAYALCRFLHKICHMSIADLKIQVSLNKRLHGSYAFLQNHKKKFLALTTLAVIPYIASTLTSQTPPSQQTTLSLLQTCGSTYKKYVDIAAFKGIQLLPHVYIGAASMYTAYVFGKWLYQYMLPAKPISTDLSSQDLQNKGYGFNKRFDKVPPEISNIHKFFRDPTYRTACTQLGSLPHFFILLEGPPGTGKSRLAQDLAASLDVPFKLLASSEFNKHYAGDTSTAIRQTFTETHKLAEGSPDKIAILGIDEIEVLVPKRAISSNSAVRDANLNTTTFLGLLQGFETSVPTRVIVIATTNCVASIDDAVIRAGRFKSVYVDNPASTEFISNVFQYLFANRPKEALSINSCSNPQQISRPDLSTLAKKMLEETDKEQSALWTFAELKGLFDDSILMCCDKSENVCQNCKNVCQEYIISLLSSIAPQKKQKLLDRRHQQKFFTLS